MASSPRSSAALTALVYGALLTSLLAARGWDATSFVMAGIPVVARDSLPAGFAVIDGQAGYDGQYYYRLALEPFTREATAHGIRLDLPAYRQQRILYPVLARLASLGQPSAIPSALILINFLALVALGWLGGVFARQLDRSPLWGTALPLYIGFVTSLSRDLAEPLECALVLGGLLLLRRERPWIAGAALAAAVLTRETAILVPAGVALAGVIHDRQRLQRNWLPAIGVPLVVFALWQVWLWHVWGVTAFGEGSRNAGAPFSGLMVALGGGIWHWHWPWVLAVLVILATAIAGAVAWRTSPLLPGERWSWLLYLLLLVSVGSKVWGDNHAFIRAAAEFSMLGALLLLAAEQRWTRWILGAGLIAWLGAASQLV